MWREFILSICHVLSKVPHKKLDKTLYEKWKGHGPNLKYIKPQDSQAKVGTLDPWRNKIGPKMWILRSLVVLKIVQLVDLLLFMIMVCLVLSVNL